MEPFYGVIVRIYGKVESDSMAQAMPCIKTPHTAAKIISKGQQTLIKTALNFFTLVRLSEYIQLGAVDA